MACVKIRSRSGKKILAEALAETDPDLLRFMVEIGKRSGPLQEIRFQYDDEELQNKLRCKLESSRKQAAEKAIKQAKEGLR